MNKKNTVFVFDVDGTLTKTNLYTPILIELKAKKKYGSILLLYFISPLIYIIDFISRSTHQMLFYKFFIKTIKNYKSGSQYYRTLCDKEINKICRLIKKIKQKKYPFYFVSTNCNLMEDYLKAFEATGIYTVNTAKLTLPYLKNFKTNTLSEIQKINPQKKIIGIADSKSDMPFLKKCTKGYLLINNKLKKV